MIPFLIIVALLLISALSFQQARIYSLKQRLNKERSYAKALEHNSAASEKQYEAMSKGYSALEKEVREAKKAVKEILNGEGHLGDLSVEQEAELVARLDEVLSHNDALLDEIDSLKG